MDVARLVECLSSMYKVLGYITVALALRKRGRLFSVILESAWST